MKQVAKSFLGLAVLASLRGVEGFQAARPLATTSSRRRPTRSGAASPNLNLFSSGKKEAKDAMIEEPADVETSGGWTDFGKDPSSYAYVGAWVALMAFTFVFGPGELNGASDTAMIQSIFDNPAAPDMNPFYYGVFNVFAIIPVVLACTIAPRASDEGIPAGPPLFLSTFIAYFVMGPYLALRKTPKEGPPASADDLGWVTRNVWENKLFNYGTVAFGFLCLLAGAAPGFDDPAGNFAGAIDLIQTSRFASVSMADLSLITLILTKEVADDYRIRCDPENVDRAPLIGASTALLPILGAAIYCAARPSLAIEEE